MFRDYGDCGDIGGETLKNKGTAQVIQFSKCQLVCTYLQCVAKRTCIKTQVRSYLQKKKDISVHAALAAQPENSTLKRNCVDFRWVAK